jgi:hypothetical protein
MKTVLLKTMPGPISIVGDLEMLAAISAPAVHLIPRAFETMRHHCLIEFTCLPQPLILLAANSARCKALVIRRTSRTRHRSERGAIGSAHESRSFGRLMHGSSPFLKSGWPVGVEPTRDMSHSHARHSDSRHGHSWSTWGYSKTHSADYRSAALPLELQVQSCWSRQQGFNPHPSPYRGDTLALSYAVPEFSSTDTSSTSPRRFPFGA